MTEQTAANDGLGNMWGIGMQGGDIIILLPPRKLSKNSAITFAAWIVALAERGEGEFQSRLNEIMAL